MTRNTSARAVRRKILSDETAFPGADVPLIKTAAQAVDVLSKVGGGGDLTAIKAKTDGLPASPAAVGSAMTLTSAYDAAKTAATQTSVNNIATQVGTAGAGLTVITARTGLIPNTPADGVALGVKTDAALDKNTDDNGTQTLVALARSIIDRLGNVGTSDIYTAANKPLSLLSTKYLVNSNISAAYKDFAGYTVTSSGQDLMFKVYLGVTTNNTEKNIAGNGVYYLRAKETISSKTWTFMDDEPVAVSSGTTKRSHTATRPDPFGVGSIVAVGVKGLAADTGINAKLEIWGNKL